MAKKYIVRLTAEERLELNQLIKTGKATGYKRCHARIPLKADAGERSEGRTDKKISNAFT